MLKCASGHPRILPLHHLPQLLQALHHPSRCVNCVSIRPRSQAPVVALETSKTKPMTGKGDGKSKNVGHHVNVTLKLITATMALEV